LAADIASIVLLGYSASDSMTNLGMILKHTPYDGSSKPFAIGLKPLDLAGWLEFDEHREAYLAEKRRLYAEIPEKVFVAEGGTERAQQEVLDLVVEHLGRHAPEPAAPLLEALGSHAKGDIDTAPLKAASLLVQEDLVLMRRGEDGWRLVAASLCFPSAWSLEEKFGKPLQDIHTPVPGFGRGTRTAEIITRIFDNLQVTQPVERMNWSLQAGPALYMPLSNAGRIERAVEKPSRFPGVDVAANAFMRVERQTLRRLPSSGDILFTIRIYLDPMRTLERHPDRATIAASFAAQLAVLDTAQIDYKGLSADRDRLVAALNGMAAN
jgi:dimethylamine monooxygenase subunit A